MKKLILMTIIFAQSFAWAEGVKLLVDNKEASKVRMDLIKDAKSEILAEYFEVGEDDFTLAGIALLREAAQRGVKVKIIIDWMYNHLSREMMAALLQNSNNNLEIRLFNPIRLTTLTNPLMLTNRTHDKLFIVDGRHAVLGSRNAAATYFGEADVEKGRRNFRDIDLYINDGSTVTDARDYFYGLWNKKNEVKVPDAQYLLVRDELSRCSGDNYPTCEEQRAMTEQKIRGALQRLSQLVVASNNSEIAKMSSAWRSQVANVSTIKFLANDTDRKMTYNSNKLSDQLRSFVLEKAKKSFSILTPYLYPTEKSMEILAELVKRGVKIKIVTNSLKSTDNYYAQAGYRQIKDQLIKMGIELYEYQGPEIEHAKAAVIDDQIVMLGSYNFDRRSSNLNRELGVIVNSDNSGLAADLNEAILSFQAKSLLVGKDGQERNKDLQDKDVTDDVWKKLRNAKILLPLIRSQI